MRLRCGLSLVLLCAYALYGKAQLSPGPLLSAHQDLEGMTRCVRCHPLGRKKMDVACLDCHREIEWLREQNRGLHAQVRDRACSSCHTDHAGKDFDPIGLKEGSFRHEETGWRLEGKHESEECSACHRREFWKSPARTQRSESSARQTYLGLETRCTICHSDDHDRQLGEDCLICHSMAKFAGAPGFQHETTKFPLHGKHLALRCEQCHAKLDSAGKSLLFPARNVAQCSACHQDPHAGRLGPKCADCHSEIAWNSNIGAGFDHAKTRFALVGAHRSVKCERCHDEKTGWGAKPAFATCSGCHVDPHRDAKKAALLSGDCKRCHDEQGFRPAHFDVAAHAKTKFALEGAHRKVKCADCHKQPTIAGTRDSLGFAWKFADLACESCHQNAHGTQLAALRTQTGACTNCHDSERFAPSHFGRDEHAKTKFALEAAHVDVACARCHASGRQDLPPPPNAQTAGSAHFVFALTERACADCHADPHKAGNRSKDCERCHTLAVWRPTRVDQAAHKRFGLDLTGAHAALPCVECHVDFGRTSRGSTLVGATSSRSLPFSARVRQCADCHAVNPGGSR